MAENDENIAAIPQNMPFGPGDAGKVASAQVLKGRNLPFDPFNQNYTATSFNYRDLDLTGNPSSRHADDLPPVDVEASPLVDLSSTNNIMDAILNNLQGLTPEQEEVRKQIEARSRRLSEHAKRVSNPTSRASSERGMT